MNRQLICLLMLLCLATPADAHIFFLTLTDKADSTYLALSERAIARREAQNIPIDSSDYAVCPAYVRAIQQTGVQVVHTSRWFNGVTIKTEMVPDQLNQLPFVKEIMGTRMDYAKPVYSPAQQAPKRVTTTQAQPQADTDTQLSLYNLDTLRRQGMTGEGMLIAIIDDGFAGSDTMLCFQHLRDEGRVLGYFNCTDLEYHVTETQKAEEGFHGTYVWSILAGELPDYHGAASGASYCLIRSEVDESESISEADNLVASLELADSIGADIISISLGYREFDSPDHFPCDYTMMNGHTFRSSIAATMAADRGMLVCSAMGNDGNKSIHYLGSPADAERVVAVGAVAADSTACEFSSYGPTADLRIKPEVCALGQKVYVINPDGKIRSGSGTSFSTPLISGLLATVWAERSYLTAAEMRQLLIRSSHLYPGGYDAQRGCGIPDAYWMVYGEKTDIEALPIDSASTTYYDLLGRPVTKDYRGIRISEKKKVMMAF